MLLLNLQPVSRWTVLACLKLGLLRRCEASCQDLVIILPNFSGVVPYLFIFTYVNVATVNQSHAQTVL